MQSHTEIRDNLEISCELKRLLVFLQYSTYYRKGTRSWAVSLHWLVVWSQLVDENWHFHKVVWQFSIQYTYIYYIFLSHVGVQSIMYIYLFNLFLIHHFEVILDAIFPVNHTWQCKIRLHNCIYMQGSAVLFFRFKAKFSPKKSSRLDLICFQSGKRKEILLILHLSTQVQFLSPIYHLNVSSSTGHICLGLLSEENWLPTRCVLDVLSALFSLLIKPELENPADQAILNIFNDNRMVYEDKARKSARNSQ